MKQILVRVQRSCVDLPLPRSPGGACSLFYPCPSLNHLALCSIQRSHYFSANPSGLRKAFRGGSVVVPDPVNGALQTGHFGKVVVVDNE